MENKDSVMEVGGENSWNTSYFYEDFGWEDLRNEIETKSEKQCEHPHITKLNEVVEEANNKDAWQSFHQHYSVGIFFKEYKYL